MKNKWLALFLALMGMLLGTISLTTYLHSQSLLAEGGTTTGTVTKLESSAKGAYYPVVRFKTDKGEEFEERGKVGSSPPEHRQGETVSVIYNKANPKDWCVNSWLNLYFLPTLFGAFSAALLFAALVVGAYSRLSVMNRKRIGQ